MSNHKIDLFLEDEDPNRFVVRTERWWIEFDCSSEELAQRAVDSIEAALSPGSKPTVVYNGKMFEGSIDLESAAVHPEIEDVAHRRSCVRNEANPLFEEWSWTMENSRPRLVCGMTDGSLVVVELHAIHGQGKSEDLDALRRIRCRGLLEHLRDVTKSVTIQVPQPVPADSVEGLDGGLGGAEPPNWNRPPGAPVIRGIVALGITSQLRTLTDYEKRRAAWDIVQLLVENNGAAILNELPHALKVLAP